MPANAWRFITCVSGTFAALARASIPRDRIQSGFLVTADGEDGVEMSVERIGDLRRIELTHTQTDYCGLTGRNVEAVVCGGFRYRIRRRIVPASRAACDDRVVYAILLAWGVAMPTPARSLGVRLVFGEQQRADPLPRYRITFAETLVGGRDTARSARVVELAHLGLRSHLRPPMPRVAKPERG